MTKQGKGFLYVTATRTIISKKCNLIGAWLVSSSGGASIATLYAGIDTNAKIIIPLSAVTSDTANFEPPEPLLCEQGLHVVLGTHATGVLIEFEPV